MLIKAKMEKIIPTMAPAETAYKSKCILNRGREEEKREKEREETNE